MSQPQTERRTYRTVDNNGNNDTDGQTGQTGHTNPTDQDMCTIPSNPAERRAEARKRIYEIHGRPASGAYPDVNRLELARQIGCAPTGYLSYVFSGRTVPRMDVAQRMAKAMGVGLDELTVELGKQQKKFKAGNRKAAGKRGR